MKAVRLYLLLLVGTGVPFGVITGLLWWSAAKGMVGGVLFGVVMSVLLGTLAPATRGGRGGSVSPRQERRLRVEAEPAQVHRCAAWALDGLPATLSSPTEPHRVEAVTGTSWNSWGDHVSVELRPDGNATEVVVRSRPRVATTLVDFGRGRKNVDSVVEGLRTAGPVHG